MADDEREVRKKSTRERRSSNKPADLIKPELPKGQPKDKEKTAPRKAKSKTGDGDFLSTALKRADAAHKHDQENIEQAYEDLTFLAGDQWPNYAKQEREANSKPIQTFNVLPQYVNQITGDIQLMKLRIKAIPMDSRAKKSIADLIGCMFRYIQRRSVADSAFNIAMESQVSCGIGHLRVTTEYAEETTFNQEILIEQIEDGVAVAWDPDSKLPTREDAKWCIVYFDKTRQSYEDDYPDFPIEDINSYDKQYTALWVGDDKIRVGEYWEKRPGKRRLALLSDGSIDDLTGKDAAAIQALKMKDPKVRIEDRDGHKVFRSVITLGHVLEEAKEWAGRYIPIIPFLGKEIRIGRKVIRYGVVRFAKEPQRSYNFARTSQTELIALAPKSPFKGTEKNFAEYLDIWETANTKNHAYLPYTPDVANGNVPPTREPPIQSSSALTEQAMLAAKDIQSVIGIYNTSLGARSNETSGVAINARDRQADVGNVGYVNNFKRSLAHCGRVMVDLIPHVYDTERMVHIVGEDDNIQQVPINKAMASPELADDAPDPIDIGLDGEDYKPNQDQQTEIALEGEAGNDQAPVSAKTKPEGVILNDVTVGAYGVVVESGPTHSTQREEAREGMQAFMQAAPQVAPLIMDLWAKAQDWPMAGEIAKRIEATLPPPIQQLLAQEKQGFVGEIPPGGQQPQPPPQPQQPPPNPEQVAVMQEKMAEIKAKTTEWASKTQIAQINVTIKQLELAIAQAEAAGDAHARVYNEASDRAAAGDGDKPNGAGQKAPPADTQAIVAPLQQELDRLRGMVVQLIQETHGGQPGNQPMPPQPQPIPGGSQPLQ